MNKKYTILEAAKEVLLSFDNQPMPVAEIYAKILERSLYTFRAQAPVSVLRSELRSIPAKDPSSIEESQSIRI